MKSNILPTGRDAPPAYSFFVEIIQRINNNLASIKNYSQISRGKFSDRAFGEYYYRTVTEDIEKIEMVLNSLIDYVKLQTTIRRVNTVHNIIESVLRKYQVKLEEKGINLLKRFEKDLPETVVPDEQLRYVLSSVLQYAMVAAPCNLNIVLSTKSLLPEKKTGEAGEQFNGDGKQIEISLVFSVHPKSTRPIPETTAFQKEEAPGILLRFVKEVVLRNHGTMRIGTNKKRTKTIISLRFPVERRRVRHPQSVN